MKVETMKNGMWEYCSEESNKNINEEIRDSDGPGTLKHY